MFEAVATASSRRIIPQRLEALATKAGRLRSDEAISLDYISSTMLH
jgi:hypothetical protein